MVTTDTRHTHPSVTPLVVYRASAGSGKTFRLAVEYMKLLIKDPTSYQHILAVTFTNKATEEMKTRILSQLYGISNHSNDADTQNYLAMIMKELDVSEAFVRERAEIALHNLLHNYSYFRIETIDSFFQSVLRNLARELDLSAGLRVELNDEEVEYEAVDRLIDQLTASSVELSWIMSYIRDNIEDDKTWNIIGQIKKFGKHIFNDVYKEERDSLERVLHGKDFFSSYVSRLRKIQSQAEKNMLHYADEFFFQLNRLGLSVSQLAYGESGVASYFVKLRRGIYNDSLLTERIKKGLDDPMAWLKKADQSPSSDLYGTVVQTLHPLLVDSECTRPTQFRLYSSAKLTLKHLNQLRLLSSIDEHVRNINKETGCFLLSDTQTLLQSLIRDSDSPFVFEKIGTQLEHIMIDEFQDTSTVQWDNFKVLLHECMSHSGTSNLIVGDVKQSIYRWRSGDWRLLNDIGNQFSEGQVKIFPMQDNYRSATCIVDFNNAFFSVARDMEAAAIAETNPDGAGELLRAYADVEQVVADRSSSEGYVNIQLLPSENSRERMLQAVKDTITQLLALGATPSQIAVLVRSNKTIRDIADYLQGVMPDLPLVSDEAFRLDASLAVNVLVEAMRTLAYPDQPLIRAGLVRAYQCGVLGKQLPSSCLVADDELLASFLPETFVIQANQLRSLPVYDLAERLFTIFSLERLNTQSAYICAFYDRLNKYLTDNVADLEMFLEAWDDDLHSRSIQSDGIEGVRLLTIHKSKGLEFENVIIPFCDWRLEKESLLWCRLGDDAAPFNELPLVPVDFNASKMRGTIFENDYEQEHLQNVVDNLNLLYVAFTRARRHLFVFGRQGSKNMRSLLIGECLPDVSSRLAGSSLVIPEKGQPSDHSDSSIIQFSYGHLSPSPVTNRISDNIFRQQSQPVNLQLEVYPCQTVFRQSNKSREFVAGDMDHQQKQNYIQAGTVLHALFSTIHTTADIPQALQQLENDGILYSNDLTRERLQAMLQKRLTDPRVADWFSPRWQLFNECSILFVDPETGRSVERRPDRVMTDGKETVVVDFKFGTPHDEHQRQVADYMALLSHMGHAHISGYLWYVYSNQILKVT